MQIVISSCGRFHSHQAAAEMYRQGNLARYISTYNEPDVPRPYQVHVPLLESAHRALRRATSPQVHEELNRAKKRVFDLIAERYATEGDILNIFSSLQPRSLDRARRRGIVTVSRHTTAHPEYQYQILKEEFARFAPDIPYYRSLDSVRRLSEELNSVDHVLIPSNYVRETFEAVGASTDGLLLLHQGVDTNRFAPAPHPPEHFHVLFVGALSFQKGTHYLLQAWQRARLPDAKLTLVGSPRPEMISWLEQDIKNCIHRGAVPHTEIGAIYQTGSVLVLASLNDGFPNAVLEAMACGLPVIISENVGAKDVVTDGKEGFVVPIRDPGAIADRLTLLYENEDLRRQMGRRARKQAESLSQYQFGTHLVTSYRQILDYTDRQKQSQI